MNNSLGVKYNTGVKLALLINQKTQEHKIVMVSIKDKKIVDGFIPINPYEITPKHSFSMWIRQLGSNQPYKKITKDEFIDKYCIAIKEEKVVEEIVAQRKNIIVAKNKDLIISFLKVLAFRNSYKFMALTEKHMGIDMLYGYNLTQKLINKLG